MASIEQYNAAITEAKRFIEKAENALVHYERMGNMHTASAKRASLDLTRVLSEFRRG